MEKRFKLLLMVAALFAPLFVFGAGASDDFVVPFMDMLTTWMTGNVGTTIAIIIMIISVIAGAFGGGFGVIGKGFVLSIIVGGVIWFAEQAVGIGRTFDSTVTP